MDSGIPYEEAHDLALERYGVSEVDLYARAVVEKYPEYFDVGTLRYWGIDR